ncbi:MAG: site-specific integrase [Verrucomicrobiota bacterium]
MPLELRWKLSGPLRPFWYGRYEVGGKRFCSNLGVKIAGTPPASHSLLEEGDAAFERSRATAQAKLDQIVEEARSKQGSERLVEKLYEIKTGEAVKSVRLVKLSEEWLKIPRKRKPDDRYASQCQSTLKRFAEFVQKLNPKADEIAHVTRTVARSFMDAEEKRGVTAKTWNDVLKLLRATFQHLLPAGAINPFLDMPTRETETVFRIPFTPEELKAIMDAAQDDEFIRPILVTGICTAMRRGDCCLLEWPDVDMERRFITVKTAKTGQTVSIPIFPMLYDELKELAKEKGKSEGNVRRDARAARAGGYVFPDQAKMYEENPDGITWRVKKILAVALGESVPDGPTEEGDAPNALAEVSEDTARKRGAEYIAKLDDGEKKQRMAHVFALYMGGRKIGDVAEVLRISKGSVSGYLNDIETAVGCRIVRGHGETQSMTGRLNADTGLLWVKREGGTRRASVRDFHSFRVTWVTLALTAGVPLELVQKVTGHKTTDIVLKHYFQPGREAFRQALQTAMPKLLTNGQKSPKDEMLEILEATTVKTWMRDQKRLLELVKL